MRLLLAACRDIAHSYFYDDASTQQAAIEERNIALARQQEALEEIAS